MDFVVQDQYNQSVNSMLCHKNMMHSHTKKENSQIPSEQKDTIELQYIESLQQHLHHILQTAEYQQTSHQNNLEQFAIAQLFKQQLEEKYDQMSQRLQTLQVENTQLKTNLNLCTNKVKQLERKQTCLNKKIAQLTHTITQKQAVIKYLQQKQQSKTRGSSKSSQQGESPTSNSSSIYIPNLQLQNLSMPKTLKEPTFHDFMPATTRSTTSECMKAESTIPSIDLNKEINPSVTAYENYQSLQRRNNQNTQRHWNQRKTITYNTSSLLLRDYNNQKDYKYDSSFDSWKNVTQNIPRQVNHRFVSTYSSDYFNRYSLATTRPRFAS